MTFDPFHHPVNPDEDVLGLTEDYIHGTLSPERAGYVEDRIAKSEVWRAAHEEAKARAAAMRSVPMLEPAEDLVAAALTLTTTTSRRRDRKVRIFTRTIPKLFTAAALILLAVHAYLWMLSPGGYDLRVLGQNTLSAGGPGSLRVCLVDPASNRPVVGVPIEVSLRASDGGKVTLAKFETDTRGTGSPRYTLPDWSEGEYRLRVTAGSESVERRVTLKRPSRVMLSTDKPVYQPGQTIHARTLALRRADGKPISGHEVIFTIADPKGTIIFKHRTVTSGFGIASADCPLADEIIHGPYTLRCAIGDTESTRTVDVKPYVLPKFRVGVEVDEPYLRPGQLVRATIEAAYFFGQPVAGGTADVEVATPGPGTDLAAKDKSGAGSVQHQQVALDRDGRARVEFRVPERLIGTERDAGDARLVITAKVTDTAGQIQVRAIHRLVSSEVLRLEVLPESGALLPGVANRVYVLVTTPDGRPAPGARVSVAGLDRELVASELGVASFEITPSAADAPGKSTSPWRYSRGTYDIALDVTVKATDAAGRSASRRVTLSGREIADDFLLTTDAAAYRAGGTLTIGVLGSGVEPVFVDLIKDGQTLLTQVVEIKSGRGELAVDLPADVSGTIQLAAYRFGQQGVAAHRTRTILVEAANDLQVAVTPGKPQYRPGERATLNLAVTGPGGTPAPGAVSIGAVDKAVYSVLDQAPGTERTLLEIDDELLKPVYTVYPWAPTSLMTPVRKEFDRAVFSATAADAGNRHAALQALVDNGYVPEEMLAVLDSPRAESMINDLESSGELSAEGAAVLRGSNGALHSINESTWPAKQSRVRERRAFGNELLATGWGFLGGAAAIVLIVALCVFVRAVRALLAILALFMLGVLIMLPSLGKARASARQLKESTEMRGIAQGLSIAGMSGDALKAKDSPTSLASGPRVREWFPETLLWRPEIITDDAGRATVEVDLADSITTWRVFGGAVTRDGRLGSLDAQLAVFQPFFVDVNPPPALTLGDEVSVPLVVYNYLDSPQTVRLTLARTEWFELLSAAEQTIELPGKDVRAASVRIRATRAGAHQLEVAAVSESEHATSDAVRRTIEVLPGGRAIENVFAGSLATPLTADIYVPPNIIDGSGKLLVKVYPSPLSQLVEGLENIFQAPYGCFEQTSSTTYPNVLALQYLRTAGQSAPAVEARARQFIHLGYQRLISFEVAGGGFDWFGRPPANRLLTAYGLMEFSDMARVHDVDPALIQRTRQWLLAQRRPDGSWAPEHHGLESAPATLTGDSATLITSAYIAWAVFGAGADGDATITRQYLESASADRCDDPYLMALMVQALAASGGDERPWLRRLTEVRRQSRDAAQSWWTRAPDARTAFYGGGRYGDVEATALATLALLQHKGDVTAARGALAWLIAARDGAGTWGTTQATVLALKALVAASDAPLGEAKERAFAIEADGHVVRRVAVSADQAEVLQQIDLSDVVALGARRITVRQERGPTAQAQIVFRAAVPGSPEKPADVDSPLHVAVRYDRDALRVGEELKASASLTTTSSIELPMVMLELPIPPGFEPRRADFEAMVANGRIARYDMTPRRVIVYLLALRAGEGLSLKYSLRATMPVSAQAEGPIAYEYYNPDRRSQGAGIALRVDPASN